MLVLFIVGRFKINIGIIEAEKVIYSEDGKTKKGVVKEHFAKVIKRCSDRVENEDPNMKRSRENTMREHSEKVENVLHHVADNFLPVSFG